MYPNMREVCMETYIDGELYSSDSQWVEGAEEDVHVEFRLTRAIFDLISNSKSVQMSAHLEEDAAEGSSVTYCAFNGDEVQLSVDMKDAREETDVKYVISELLSGEGLSLEVAESSTGWSNASPETHENCPTESTNVGMKNRISGFLRKLFGMDPAQLESEPEVDLVDSVASEPASSEGQEVDVDEGVSDLKRPPLLVCDDLSASAGSSSGVVGSSSGMDAAPEAPENCPKESINMGMINRISGFLRKLFGMDPAVPESEPEPDLVDSVESEPEPDLVDSVESEPEPDLVVSVESEPEPDLVDSVESEPEPDLVDSVESEPEPDLVDSVESEPEPDLVDSVDSEPEPDLVDSVESEPEPDLLDSVESEPEPDLVDSVESEPEPDLVYSCESWVPAPSSSELDTELDLVDKDESWFMGSGARPQASTSQQNPLEDDRYLLLEERVKRCTLRQTPVTEVCNNIFIGNEEIAFDRTKLKEMGITHILNVAALKRNLRIILGFGLEKDKSETFNTGASYYRGMKIVYRGLHATKKLNITKYFLIAVKFIYYAKKNPENKVLIHCTEGINYAPTFFIAFLVICRRMTLEDAIDYLMKFRYIKPNVEFLKQLAIFSEELVHMYKL